jgi:hypothetical protein
MREMNLSSRLLGYVQLRVGDKLVAVPVQAMKLDRDGGKRPGGFYTEGVELGIYVDEEAPEHDVEEQIRRASNDAVLHIAKKIFN